MKQKIIKYFIDKAKRNKLLQNMFEQPIDLSQFPVKGVFTDEKGNEHKLYNGLRSKFKPGWQNIFSTDGKTLDTSPGKIEQIARDGRIATERILPIINIYKPDISQCSILEVGCHAGGSTFSFAEQGAKEVVGTEFSGYKLKAKDDRELETKELEEVNQNLKDLRDLVGKCFKNSSKVSFADDDICNSTLPKESFDVVCSWDVLEHLHDPLAALKSINALLKPGGISVHDYNPFFSIIGGHSACTIDFPWGHVLLNHNDFKRFNEEIQPQWASHAMAFYLNGINRMTQSDMVKYSEESGLELLSMITYPKEQYLRMVDKRILDMVQTNYPNVTLNDLISQRIIVIHRKKK
ncbi:MAG: class I SAM-dependent methyltransferase [Bacteroidales bacterium]|nr:class I SAM-dependent methyltransferase [Bacteroidales bacterium]MCF8455032.1 class I SAM-dependent methyltransferase [Bacteroidales bacterium]